MPLMKGFVKVDSKGKVQIPRNIQVAADLKPGQLVEVKVAGPTRSNFITIHKRSTAK